MDNPLALKIARRQQNLLEQGLLRQRRSVSTDAALGGSLANVPTHAPAIRAKNVLVNTSDSPRFVFEDQSYLNFSSNDYLGLSRTPELIQAAYQGAQRYGVGSGASPLVTGYSDTHVALEQQLCKATGHEAALLFCSGFSANTALMKTLFDNNDIVIADKLVHASIIDGLRDSRATFKRFVHNSLESAQRLLEQSLRGTQSNAVALITESIFSMDGDCAPIEGLAALCKSHHAWLIVDDAHGFGVLNGFANGESAKMMDVQIVTFGKALGCQGAAILGSKALIDFLVSNAREYIYSTALSPASAYVALEAVRYSQQPQLRRRLTDNIALFKQLCAQKNVPLMASDTPIQPVLLGDSEYTVQVGEALKRHGIWVGVIRPPTVPMGAARLRVTITASHNAEDIAFCVNSLAQVLSMPRATLATNSLYLPS